MMNISELSKLTGKPIVVTDYVDRKGEEKYQASIKGLEMKDGSFLKSTWGRGSSPKAAMMDYCKEVSDSLLVADAHTARRVEYNLSGIVITIGKIKSDYQIVKSES